MHFFYNLGILAYYTAVKLSSAFGKEKASLWIKGRINWEDQLAKAIPNDKKVYWFHVASLGEFEQARPLIENLQNPENFILLTFFSPSGYEIKKDYKGADYVCYLPLDTPSNAQKFITISKPDYAIFIKYEFWFNYLKELKKQSIPTYLVSGIFRPKQHFFKWYGGWFREQLKCFSFFYVQNEKSKKLLSTVGISRVSVTGDTRFDRVINTSKEPLHDFRFSSFSEKKKVIVFGSSWPQEDRFAVMLKKKHPEFKIIIAPHEIEKEKIEKLRKEFEGRTILFSDTKPEQNLSDYEVLIIDSIGLLSKIYRFAYISVIGGGFGSGIHNILEAAVYGTPIIIGPKYKKFQEAKDLVKLGGAHSYSEYPQSVNDLILNESKVKQSALITKEYVLKQAGATKAIMKNLELKKRTN